MHKSSMKPRAVVIGGTGMLAGLLDRLLDSHNVIALARGLTHPWPTEPITTVRCDYQNNADVNDAVDRLIADPRPIDLIVSWIHSPTEDVERRLIQPLLARYLKCRWVAIRSSAASRPVHAAMPEWLPDTSTFVTVRLGFVIEGDRSRWLSDHEIVAGVAEAILTGNDSVTVGTLDPWSRRP